MGPINPRPAPQLFPADVSLCGVVRTAPLVSNCDLYPDFNISFPFQLVWSSDISGQTPTPVSLAQRGKAIYIIGRFLHGKALPNFCDCWPGSGGGKVVLVGRGCLISPAEALLDGKARWRDGDSCRLSALPCSLPEHGAPKTRPSHPGCAGHQLCHPSFSHQPHLPLGKQGQLSSHLGVWGWAAPARVGAIVDKVL